MKKLVVILAALSLAACNKSSPGESAKPAAKPIVNGVATPVNGGAQGSDFPAAPPPKSSTATNGKVTANDDQIISGSTVIPSAPSSTATTSRPAPSRPTTVSTKPATDTSTTSTPTTTTTVENKPGQQEPTVPPARPVGEQCAEPYRETRPEWAPGLPYPPLEKDKAVFTDLPNDSGLRFTDARRDDLFKVAVDRANAFPDTVKKGNQEFAKQIRDVKISTDLSGTREVKVRIVYLHQMQKEAIELRGVLEKPEQVALAQVPVPGAPKDAPAFGGLLTCTDADHGCKNILLRLDLKAKSGKIARSAYIVHRWSAAHVMQSETERVKFARIPNQNQSAFAEYVSNSLNNQCLALLADATLPACAKQRLQAECGTEDAKKPAAKDFGLRTWAVAYGKAGFEFVMTGKDYDGVADIDVKRTPFLTVRGPLAHSKNTPMFSHPLVTSGNVKGLNEVYLMNNDGGGNLNLRFDFGSTQDTQSRLSVSSLLPNTAYSQSVVQAAQNSPNVPQADVEQQDLVSAE